jgi:hypothetical protein
MNLSNLHGLVPVLGCRKRGNLLNALALLLVPAALVACGADDGASTGSDSNHITQKESATPGEENGICGGIGGFECKPCLVCVGVGVHPDAAGTCGPASAPGGAFCKDGTIESEPSYVASTDGKECKLPSVHCITKDAKKCPMASPYPPNFCSDGSIESGPPSFVASTDGEECKLPSVHCITKDAKKCPMP